MRTTHSLRLPDFLVVGPPRTATTWLDEVLRGEVGLPAGVKETHFFARNYERGIEWYAAHFAQSDPRQKVGEVCAAYFENSDARERIHRHIPHCKIICTLRDPVDRLYSYYKLMRQGGKTELPFERAVQVHAKMLKFSRYATILRKWNDRFGKENVLAVINDDLQTDPQSYVDQVSSFIGVKPITLPSQATSQYRPNTIELSPRSARLARAGRKLRSSLGANGFYRTRSIMGRAGLWRFCSGRGDPFPPMEPQTRVWLQQQLLADIEQLEELLGRDLTAWKSDRGCLPTVAPAAPQ